jgi:hypothetical protein
MRIRFGATDIPECPKCRNHMLLTRRVPHPIYGVEFERQTFKCRSCSHEVERNADRLGEILDRQPSIWGYDDRVLYFALKKIEDENARWDAVDADAVTDEAGMTRMAKSCDPDAAVLASSCVEVSAQRRFQESRSPGRAPSKP